jgi:hypothetical protein
MRFNISKYNNKNGKSLNKQIFADTYKEAIEKVEKINKKIKNCEEKWNISVINY